jgi:hypothetical protein
MIYISLHNKLRIVQHEPLLKYGDKIGWDERVSLSNYNVRGLLQVVFDVQGFI